MAIFKRNSEGGMMDVIRCDEKEYLIWKWRPSSDNNSKKENAIRYGSVLRVKDGEMAIFVYQKDNREIQEYIIGPHDQTIKSANFPILSNIVGTAYGGSSPFQAEIYFINLSGNIQLKFGIPYFDVFDPRFTDFSVPVSTRGAITFNITDYEGFIKLNRLIEFNLDQFNHQIKEALIKHIKGIITNIPAQNNLPVLQLEKKLLEINELVYSVLFDRLKNDFGVNLKTFDLSSIEVDKESKGYIELRKITSDQFTKTTEAQTEISIKNLEDIQAINAMNIEESLRIQREELQRIQKLQTESNYMGAHVLNQQSDVLKTGAENLGSMGNMNLDSSSGSGGINAAGMMTGMMMGGAMGNQMAGMMNQMGQQVNQQQNTPPPPPIIQYNLSINGQIKGPYNWQQLIEMAQKGELTKSTFVWKPGMDNWENAENVDDFTALFKMTPPPPPKQ